MTKKSELLPCPFCGSEAEQAANTLDDTDGHAWCTNYECGCDMYADTRARVVEMWNRRTCDGKQIR